MEYERLDDLVSLNGPPMWDEGLPWATRKIRIRKAFRDVRIEWDHAMAHDDLDIIDAYALRGALDIMRSLLYGSCGRLRQLMSGPLWDPELPDDQRFEAILRARNDIAEKHQAHLDDDDASWSDTGLLMGALCLIDGLRIDELVAAGSFADQRNEILSNLKSLNSDGRTECAACGGRLSEPYPGIRFCQACEN
jgi:hypothetical protein